MLLLIYDDSCPLCAWYSNQFVRFGFLDGLEKTPFSHLTKEQQAQLDMQRAMNEIPLLDTKDNTVLYGIDALVKVLNRKWKFVEPIAKFPPINFVLKLFYKTISYNRKGIVAAPFNTTGIVCVPDYHTGYKLFFNFVLWVLILIISYLTPKLTLTYAFLGLIIGTTSLILWPVKWLLEFYSQVLIVLMVVTIIWTPLSFLPFAKYLAIIPVTFLCIGLVKRIKYLRQMEKIGWL